MISKILQTITFNSVKDIYFKSKGNSHFKKVYSLPFFISHLSFYLINSGLFLFASRMSPANIMLTHPRRVMYAYGFQFILMTLRIQLSGVTLDKFNPFRRTTLVTWAALIAHIIHVQLYGVSFMDETLMYLILDIVSFISLAHFIYYVTKELQAILGINLLTLTEKQLKMQEDGPGQDKK